MNLVLAQFDEDLGMWRIRVCSILAEYVAGWMVIDVVWPRHHLLTDM